MVGLILVALAAPPADAKLKLEVEVAMAFAMAKPDRVIPARSAPSTGKLVAKDWFGDDKGPCPCCTTAAGCSCAAGECNGVNCPAGCRETAAKKALAVAVKPPAPVVKTKQVLVQVCGTDTRGRPICWNEWRTVPDN